MIFPKYSLPQILSLASSIERIAFVLTQVVRVASSEDVRKRASKAGGWTVSPVVAIACEAWQVTGTGRERVGDLPTGAGWFLTIIWNYLCFDPDCGCRHTRPMTDLIETIGDLAALTGSARGRARIRRDRTQLLSGDWEKVGLDLRRVTREVVKREKVPVRSHTG